MRLNLHFQGLFANSVSIEQLTNWIYSRATVFKKFELLEGDARKSLIEGILKELISKAYKVPVQDSTFQTSYSLDQLSSIVDQHCFDSVKKLVENPDWKSNWEHVFKVAVYSDIIAHSFCWTSYWCNSQRDRKNYK